MPDLCLFDYAVVRVVPRVEREEFINAGIILYCRPLRYLAARVKLERAKLAALSPETDPAAVAEHLSLIERIAAGAADAGPIGELDLAERFRWLTAPRSTVIQVSPVHPGLCDDPADTLERLMQALV